MAERVGLTRRAVMRGTALGATVLASGRVAGAVSAQVRAKEAAYVPRPNATQHVIAVNPTSINPDGAQLVPAVLASGGLPGPEIRVREGDMLRILVENRLPDSPTSIHWHGVLLPAAMDGVPDISNAPIAPGQMYVYEYPIRFPARSCAKTSAGLRWSQSPRRITASCSVCSGSCAGSMMSAP